MIKVLALATCFNRKEKTLRAIRTLIDGNQNIDFHFIVCDDNSTDGTYEELLKIKEVEVVKGTGSLYWAGGMRKAIEKALNTKDAFDYCLWFNDDVHFFNSSIEKIANISNGNVVVGPTCDKNNILTYGGVIKTSNLRPKYKTIIGDSVDGSECDTFNGNCVLIPWQIFIKSGNIDSCYTHQFGDYDYGLTIKKNGYSIKTSNEYVGICEVNSVKNTFNDTSLSIKERIRLKNTYNKGLRADEWFHYLFKNYNLLTAVVYSISPYIRIFLGK